MTCDHGLGPVSKIAFGLQTVYRRPWRRLFRRTLIIRCIRCDVRIVEP